MLDLEKETLVDAALVGNFNKLFPLLELSLNKHTALTANEKESYIKELARIHVELLTLTHQRTFKEE